MSTSSSISSISSISSMSSSSSSAFSSTSTDVINSSGTSQPLISNSSSEGGGRGGIRSQVSSVAKKAFASSNKYSIIFKIGVAVALTAGLALALMTGSLGWLSVGLLVSIVFYGIKYACEAKRGASKL